MTDKLDCLKPEHGKPFTLKITDAKVFEALNRLTLMQNSAALYVFHILENQGNVPCTQCWKDVALLYSDIGALMMELADDKASKS